MSRNYVTIHVLPDTKERLMKKGTTKDTHDSVLSNVLDFYEKYHQYETFINAQINDTFDYIGE